MGLRRDFSRGFSFYSKAIKYNTFYEVLPALSRPGYHRKYVLRNYIVIYDVHFGHIPSDAVFFFSLTKQIELFAGCLTSVSFVTADLCLKVLRAPQSRVCPQTQNCKKWIWNYLCYSSRCGITIQHSMSVQNNLYLITTLFKRWLCSTETLLLVYILRHTQQLIL